MTREKIQEQVIEILHTTFEIPLEKIQPTSRLFDELDLDSIDAVDLIVKLQAQTSRKIDPEQFHQVRTVDDVVSVIYQIVVSDSPTIQ